MVVAKPKIYGRASSGNVQKVMWACAEAGVDVERIDFGLQFGGNNEPWYKKLNPNGLVPCFVDGDFALWESNTIIRYVAEHYGNRKLFPEDPKVRAVANQWMDWANTYLGVPFGPMYLGMVRTPPEKRDLNHLESLRKESARRFEILDARLGEVPYVAGKQFTMGDIAFGYFANRWFNLPIERPTFKNWENWFVRMKERPAYMTHVMLPLT